MSKNKKNFYVGLIGSGIIFLLGVLYMMLPNYYGIDYLVKIDVNNLFVSFSIVYATVNLLMFAFTTKDNLGESVWICVSSCIVGMINNVLSILFDGDLALKLSILLLTGLITIIKIISISYYRKKNDGIYYLEILLACIILITGVVFSLNLFDETIIQTAELGFFGVVLGITSLVENSIRCLLKAPRFLGKIKF